MVQKYVVDTSVVVEKAVSKLIEKKEIKGEFLIPHAVVAELENQANTGQEIGMLGLEEIQKLQEFAKEELISLRFIGHRPNMYQIQHAKRGGEIDALIRSIAYDEDCILITGDKVQAESAKAFGVRVKFIEQKKPREKLEIEDMFDNQTMSIHIRENTPPMAKKGKPGEWKLTEIGEVLSFKQVQAIAKEIVEKARSVPQGFIEISRPGSTVVQYKNIRIVIVKPPVSDGWEITAVRPMKKLSLDDYKLPEAIFNRIRDKARGVLIAGETGSGKSTFAQAIAEFYMKLDRIVKTVESPRDLQLPDAITQYSKSFTTAEEIHDILFLSRPDNILFDEIRDTPDFKLYTDLRLAGSNCIGVLHSASPIDAVQRFIGRLELGMIPSVLDTILFVSKGQIAKVFSLQMLVKVPTGMSEADLARPIVVVTDFVTGKLEYEIYSYGEETVVIPVEDEVTKASGMKRLAAESIIKVFKNYSDQVKVDVDDENRCTVYLPEHVIARVIGKQGKNIEGLENKLGVKIDIKELSGNTEKTELGFDSKITKKSLILFLDPDLSDKDADIYINEDFVMAVQVGKGGRIKINKKNKVSKMLIEEIDNVKILG